MHPIVSQVGLVSAELPQRWEEVGETSGNFMGKLWKVYLFSLLLLTNEGKTNSKGEQFKTSCLTSAWKELNSQARWTVEQHHWELRLWGVHTVSPACQYPFALNYQARQGSSWSRVLSLEFSHFQRNSTDWCLPLALPFCSDKEMEENLNWGWGRRREKRDMGRGKEGRSRRLSAMVIIIWLDVNGEMHLHLEGS